MLDAETLRMMDETYAPSNIVPLVTKLNKHVIKLTKKVDKILPHSLTKVKEITTLLLEEENSVVKINRLLKAKWIIIAINQFTSRDQDLQEWGTVFVLGKY